MNFPPLPLPFDLPNSCTEQFIATLLSSLSTEIKVSVSFSLNPSPPSFFFLLYFPLVCMAATASKVV